MLPAPDTAPGRTNSQHGDNLFLVQFRYTACPDLSINSMRRQKKEIQILRLLNLFTKGRIRHTSPFSRSAWVAKIDDPLNWTSEYRQESYARLNLSLVNRRLRIPAASQSGIPGPLSRRRRICRKNHRSIVERSCQPTEAQANSRRE